jgi:hypothetical protein
MSKVSGAPTSPQTTSLPPQGLQETPESLRTLRCNEEGCSPTTPANRWEKNL